MKILGLIGGISWVSTIDYYRLINQGINERLGGLNAAQCIIYSFNFADIKRNNDTNDWDTTCRMVVDACNHLKASGAEGIVFCANTLHLIADRVEAEVGLPLIHIATATTSAIQKQGLKKVGLLGTKYTMELPFFKEKLSAKHIETLIPDDEDREFVHNNIFEELGKGIFTEQSKQRYLQIIDGLKARGAEGIILGCTEIPLLIQQSDVSLPIFNTTLLHSEAAVIFSLA